jgi:lipoic acid synthetase
MGLRHVVVTSVTRDDLDDGGAGQFADTIRAIRAENPGATVEVLTPDFGGCERHVETVQTARPDVFGHNVETVERLFPVLRRGKARYSTALQVLRTVAASGAGAVVKSGFMVGHGETEREVVQTLRDLAGSGCEAVAIGQYLRPTNKQREVVSFVHPDQFSVYQTTAYQLGFSFVIAGPLVRSSYRSGEVLAPAGAYA